MSNDPLPWWKNTVIYHIYPRSFLDTNGDGIGDLNGIREKTEYLANLGVGAIWMGPVFTSPQVDNGYDIADYREIDPLFGTLDDMDALIETAGAVGIRVLLDLVFNHTSDQHPWFTASRSGGSGPYEDYYIWRDPAPDGGPPNSWIAWFGGSAWTYEPRREQYYLNLFTPQQPDLNWDNPVVRRELVDIANFWIDRGVAGFRMDVINLISKDFTAEGTWCDGPRVQEYLQEFRQNLHRSDEIVLVGETPGITVERARAYTDPQHNALDMVLTFDHVMVDQSSTSKWIPQDWNAADLVDALLKYPEGLAPDCWNSIYASNHDQPRVVSRFGDDEHFWYESATALATLFYLLPGTPVVYQGDEIGMVNYPIKTVHDLADVESRNAYRHFVEVERCSPADAIGRIAPMARDNSRTPMQWNGDTHGGFTLGEKPWYPLHPGYQEIHVHRQMHCPGLDSPIGETRSIFRYYRHLIQLLKTDLFRSGGLNLLFNNDRAVLYARETEFERALVMVNLSPYEALIPGEYLSNEGIPVACSYRILSNIEAPELQISEDYHLPPFSAVVHLFVSLVSLTPAIN